MTLPFAEGNSSRVHVVRIVHRSVFLEPLCGRANGALRVTVRSLSFKARAVGVLRLVLIVKDVVAVVVEQVCPLVGTFVGDRLVVSVQKAAHLSNALNYYNR